MHAPGGPPRTPLPSAAPRDATLGATARASGAPPSVKSATVVGGSLDALVRSARGGVIGSQRSAATRLVEHWEEVPDLALELHPTRAMLGTDVAVTASQNDGRWLLPAFMAGLRTLRPREDATADDVMSLGEELSALSPNVESIAKFHDWVWADGAEGFDVSLQPSFMEMMDAIVEDERSRAMRALVLRGDTLSSLSADAVRILSRDLDAAALRSELEAPLDDLTVASDAGDLEPPGTDVAALRMLIDDPVGWVTLELDAVLARPALRDMVPPPRLARRILARLSTRLDARCLRLLTSLHDPTDPYRLAVAAALETAEVGATIGARVRVDDEREVQALREFIVGASPPIASALVARLLARADGEPAARGAIVWLCRALGFPRLVGLLDLPSLDPSAVRTLLAVARDAKVDAATLDVTFASVPPSSLIAALEALASDDLGWASKLVVGLVAQAAPSGIDPLAKLIARAGTREMAVALGEWLRAHAGSAPPGRVLYVVCGALVARGVGEAYVVPLARSAFAGDELRGIALDCLQEQPTLLAEAARFTPMEWIASGELRQKLRRARDRAGAGR